MTAAEVVRARLLTISAVTAIVVDRVYTQVLPQTPTDTLPAIRVQRVDQIEDAHLRGTTKPVRARVQVDSVAKSAAAAFALDAALHGNGDGTGLAGWTGEIGSPAVRVAAILPIDVRDGYDAEDLKQYKVMRDYAVTFTPA